MGLTDAQIRAAKKYQNKFDDIKLRVPKGEREMLQQKLLHAIMQKKKSNKIRHNVF